MSTYKLLGSQVYFLLIRDWLRNLQVTGWIEVSWLGHTEWKRLEKFNISIDESILWHVVVMEVCKHVEEGESLRHHLRHNLGARLLSVGRATCRLNWLLLFLA